jgi:hypothetical protein
MFVVVIRITQHPPNPKAMPPEVAVSEEDDEDWIRSLHLQVKLFTSLYVLSQLKKVYVVI